jgi:glycine/D-amino acid oxidase-like deaminating enzyme/nitrite reductase/ring-hydroxylating ferredoxin subunit
MTTLDPNRSLWVETTPATDHPALVGDVRADVVVVGGGITGLTTAYLLEQRGLDVVVLEAHRLALGSTGFTTAKVTSLHGLTYADLVQRFGEDRARRYGQANQAAIETVARLSETLAIDCAFTRAPAFTYTVDASERHAIAEEVEAARRLGLPGTLTTETDLPYAVEAAVRFDDQAHFHPRAYCLGLAGALRGPIHERSRVVDIDDTGDGVVVRTDAGRVTATAAVVATLLPFLDIGGFFAKAHPTRSYAMSLRCRGDVPTGMYLSIDSPSRSVRPVAIDGEPGLVVGGGGHKPGEGGDTRRYYEDLESWARATFDVVEVTHRWSAQDYVTVDEVPYIGRCPRTDHVYVATGFRKWGMTGGTVAASIIADLATGTKNQWADVFDATRVDPANSLTSFVKENAAVGVHFVKDRLARLRAGDVEALAAGEGAIVRVDGDAVGAYRDPGGSLHVVDPTCTHLGCSLLWNAAETSWDCPCHGSRFTHDGEVLEGPATRSLTRVDIDP